MTEYAEHIDLSDSKPGCHEPSANPGTGRRQTGLSDY